MTFKMKKIQQSKRIKQQEINTLDLNRNAY